MAAKTYTFKELTEGVAGQKAQGGRAYKEIDPTKKPGRGILTLRVQEVDIAAILTAASGTGAVNDKYQVMNIYPGEIIIAAGINNITADSAADDVNLGLAVSDHFLDGHTLTDVTLPAATKGYFDGPFYCVTADTLDLYEAGGANAATDGVVQVWALIAKLGLRIPSKS
jgi:hypothetical protein